MSTLRVAMVVGPERSREDELRLSGVTLAPGFNRSREKAQSS